MLCWVTFTALITTINLVDVAATTHIAVRYYLPPDQNNITTTDYHQAAMSAADCARGRLRRPHPS